MNDYAAFLIHRIACIASKLTPTDDQYSSGDSMFACINAIVSEPHYHRYRIPLVGAWLARDERLRAPPDRTRVYLSPITATT
jgi:hypothetical protein